VVRAGDPLEELELEAIDVPRSDILAMTSATFRRSSDA
jgi:hypothetical protein